MADADKKTCTSCHEQMPASNFARQGKRRRSKCMPCQRAYNRTYRASLTAEERKFQSIKYNYGVTREQYIDILLEQDFRCPICTKPLDFAKLQTDHCHEGGHLRGILDVKCNTALGKFDDNIATLSRAQAYLETRNA